MKYILLTLICFIYGCSDSKECDSEVLVVNGGKTLVPDRYKDAANWCDNFGGTKGIMREKAYGIRVRCNDFKLIIDESSHE